MYFDKNSRTIITKKHFEPGSYTIDVNSDLPGSGMYVFYSLYKKDVWSPHEGIFHEGPTNDEYHVPQQQFQIYEAQDLWFVMSSAYSGEPNTVHFSVE